MHRTDLRGNQLIIYSVLFRYFICKTQRVNDLYASLYFKTGTFNPSIWELISRWFQPTQLFQLIEKWSPVFHRQKYTWYSSFSNVFCRHKSDGITMREDSVPLVFPKNVIEWSYEEEKQCSLSSCWEPLKTWILLVFTIILLGLFYVATDKQNFIKYVSRREDLRKFILLVAWLYFVFCCLIGTLIFSCLGRLAGLLGI